MTLKTEKNVKPEILAPAGNKDAFLAALAAGADAVYCGLKSYSARMEAKNFTIGQLDALTQLAHKRKTKVYVAFNSLLKPDDLETAAELLVQLQRQVKPDALIVQDLAMVDLAHQAGYTGEIHLSTLSNVSIPAALKMIRQLPGVTRVVLPRELSIDEIKTMAAACPPNVFLEVFVHGALCYGVSGRCYWSSYLGGRSGLRGRCVQPCRRQYSLGNTSRRYFSCQDLSLDALSKVLLTVPQVRAWKIEGRKKGPHYVYYTVQAYRMLRDLDEDPENRAAIKKTAIGLLEQALGRSTTHYNFLPQRPQPAVALRSQTGSGLYVGSLQGPAEQAFIRSRIDLLPGDTLRIGYEDEPWHAIRRVGKFVPKKGRLSLSVASGRKTAKGAPVFLTDRREKALEDMLQALDAMPEAVAERAAKAGHFAVRLPAKADPRLKAFDIRVSRRYEKSKESTGIWLSDDATANVPKAAYRSIWWWLPPAPWPDTEAALKAGIDTVVARGSRNFVLNTPWQRALFDGVKGLRLFAGPFCNIANSLTIKILAEFGFSGVFISPELSQSDNSVLPQQSPLPLGIVIGGNWPLCISRTLAEDVQEGKPFSSPRGEQAWVRRYDNNYWVYPNWELDLSQKKKEHQQAGYRLFAYLAEPIPPAVRMKKRPGLWNWNVGLK